MNKFFWFSIILATTISNVSNANDSYSSSSHSSSDTHTVDPAIIDELNGLSATIKKGWLSYNEAPSLKRNINNTGCCHGGCPRICLENDKCHATAHVAMTGTGILACALCCWNILR